MSSVDIETQTLFLENKVTLSSNKPYYQLRPNLIKTLKSGFKGGSSRAWIYRHENMNCGRSSYSLTEYEEMNISVA
jgi:hypothetical protein